MAITNEKIEQMLASIQELKAAKEQEIEELRVKWLGKKGEITQLFDEFRTIDKEQKKEFGQRLNALKNAATAKIEEMRATLRRPPSDLGDPRGNHLDLQQVRLFRGRRSRNRRRLARVQRPELPAGASGP